MKDLTSNICIKNAYRDLELSNHLGNVLATITDKPILVYDNGVFDYKSAEISSVSDYFPFGQIMPERHWSSESYRFGFNSQEKVDEWNGSKGTHYTALFWEYNPLTGRRENNDPVIKPWMSPYHAFSNRPITNIDPNGAFDWEPITNEDGSTSYKAEEGDNFETFKSQFNLTLNDALSIFQKSNITEIIPNETEISGKTVKQVTGSDVLKLDWSSPQATAQRKVDQIMFGIKKSQIEGKTSFDLKDYNLNTYNKGKMFNASNKTIRTEKGKIPILNINVSSDWNTRIKSVGEEPKQIFQQQSYKHEYRDINGRYGAPRILITIDEKYFDDYTNFYY